MRNPILLLFPPLLLLFLFGTGISCSGIFPGKSDSLRSDAKMQKAIDAQKGWYERKDTTALLEARNFYRQAVDIDDKNYDGWNDIGVTYFELEKYREALPYFQKAVALKKDFAYAWCNLGASYYMLGRIDSAMNGFYQCTRYNPAYENAYLFMVKVYQDQNKPDSVLAIRKRAAAGMPDSYNAWDALAAEYFVAGDTVASVAAGEKAIAIDPSNTDRVWSLYAYFYSHGDSAKAAYYKQLRDDVISGKVRKKQK